MKASPHRPTKALIHLGAIRQNIQQMGLISLKEHSSGQWSRLMLMGMGQLLLRWQFRMKLMAFAFPISMKLSLNSDKLDSSKQILILGVSEIEAVSLAKEYDITLTVA